MRKIKFLLLVLSLIIITSCNKDDDTESTQITVHASIEGMINKENIVLNLFSEDEGSEFLRDENTDSGGVAIFSNVSPGLYSFEADFVEADGHVHTGMTPNFSVSEGQNKEISIVLN